MTAIELGRVFGIGIRIRVHWLFLVPCSTTCWPRASAPR